MAYTTIQIDLNDHIEKFQDGDLIDELKERGYTVSQNDEDSVFSREWQIYDAFTLGKNDEAMNMLRDLIQDRTGRILP